MKTKKVVQAVAIGLALAGVVCTSCSKSAKTTQNSGKRVINIASSSSPNPWIVVDDKGVPGGYDIDVIRLVFERLPQYEPRFIVTEFASIFTGLDSGMYQFGVNHLGYNRARGEKYLFSAPYDYGSHAILVKKGSPIRSVRDFGGRSTYASPTNFNANQYEEYNKRHPENPITVLYTESDGEYALGVSSGRYDFYYFTRYAIEEKEYRDNLQSTLGIDNIQMILRIGFTADYGSNAGIRRDLADYISVK